MFGFHKHKKNTWREYTPMSVMTLYNYEKLEYIIKHNDVLLPIIGNKTDILNRNDVIAWRYKLPRRQASSFDRNVIIELDSSSNPVLPVDYWQKRNM